jgi:two-component sensor histidine kinase
MTLDELYRLLRTGHVQSQGIVDTMQQPLVVLDRSFNVLSANVAFYRSFQTEPDSTVGKELFELGNGQWNIPELRLLLADVVPKASAIVGYEVKHVFPDLGERIMIVTARKLLHPDDYSTQMLVMFEDVTEQHRANAATSILLAETRHRSRNLIAMLRSVAQQTEVEGLTAAQYRDAFVGRVNAIANAQEFMFADGGKADLATVITRSVEPLAGDRAKIEVGAEVILTQHQVLPLSMIFHELTTNAIKYGALSNGHGVVHIGWAVEQREEKPHLVLNWREEGGPPVSPPKRQGFGTDLLEFSVQAEGGSSDFQFALDGLRVRIELPIGE